MVPIDLVNAMNKFTVVLMGLFCAGAPASERDTGREYLQLIFFYSRPDCRAEYDAWRKRQAPASGKGASGLCFESASAWAGAATLPPYVMQVVADLKPKDLPGHPTVTLHALGNEQLAKDIPESNPVPAGAGEVKEHELMVFSRPTQGQEEAFNDWYDHQHLPDVLRVTGFISGKRYVLSSLSNVLTVPKYLVVFKFKSGDVKETTAELAARIADGRTRMSPSFEAKAGVGLLLTPLE